MTDVEADPMDEHKAKKARSPNFPSIPLEGALTLAEKVFKAENLGFAPVGVVVTKHWGFGAKSSAWKLRLAAVIAFGLLDTKGEGDAKQVRISELAKKILLDRVPDSPERKKALAEAALAPKIYKDIRDKWGDTLGSDATVETYLVRDRNFTDSAAKAVLADYKATIAFAGLDAPDTIQAPEDEEDEPAGVPEQRAPQQPQKPLRPPLRQQAPGMRDLIYTLPTCLTVVTVQVPASMSVGDFEQFVEWLKKTKTTLTTPQPSQPAQEGPQC